MPKKKDEGEDGRGERLGAGRQLRTREPKEYKGFDESATFEEEEEEPKKGRKRGRPPKSAPKGLAPPIPAGRPAKKPPQPEKLV
eukprot:3348114-Prymnesium_polylepis.1